MRKAVRLGDLVFVKAGDGFTVSHLYPSASAGKRFRLTDTALTAEEVAGMGVDPVTGAATKAALRLHLASGEDYWCLILIDAQTREPIRSLGKVPDEVVSNIFHYRTPDVTQFPDISYDQMRRVKRARDDGAFRARTIAHMDDTRAIREILSEVLDELRKRPLPTPPKPRAPRKKKAPVPQPADEQQSSTASDS